MSPAQTTTFNQAGQPVQNKEARVPAYYSILKLPGESQPSFMLFRSFVPFSKNDSKKTLSAFMVAKSDNFNDDYGQLVSYQVPSDELVPGPALVGAAITSDKSVAGVATLLNQEGSSVTWGELVLYPIDESLLYVRPLYVSAQGGTEVPQVQDVVASFGGTVVIQPTLQQALAKLVPGCPDQRAAVRGRAPGGDRLGQPGRKRWDELEHHDHGAVHVDHQAHDHDDHAGHGAQGPDGGPAAGGGQHHLHQGQGPTWRPAAPPGTATSTPTSTP